MRLKKILIGTGVGLLAASPLIALAFVNAFPKQITQSDRFIVQPDSEVTKQLKAKVSKALDNTIGKDGELDLKYYTLYNASQFTPSKLSWFSEVNKAMAWIDPRLKFTLVPRSQITKETAYSGKNGPMITMWWSPDYHNLGTWLGYWFQSEYALPNMWESLYDDIQAAIHEGYINMTPDQVPDGSKFDKSTYEAFKAVKDFLTGDYGTLFKNDNDIPTWLKDENNFYPKNKEAPISSKVVKAGTDSATLFQSTPALEWLDHLNKINNKRSGYNNATADVMAYWFDTIDDKKLALEIVSWMDKQAGMIPFFSEGPNTTLKSLVRKGFHTPKNSYSDTTFRDWYYEGDKDTEKNPFRMWFAANPFINNKTPYNPSFNESPNNLFFQSTYNGLIDWVIKGDWKLDANGTWQPPKGEIVLSAASLIEGKDKSGNNVITYPKNGTKVTKDSPKSEYRIYEDIAEVKKDLEKVYTYEFTIDPRFDYLDINGNKVGKVQAQDFFWALVSYQLSGDLKINKNSYFLSMINVDWDETIKANPQFYDIADNSIPESHKYDPFNLRIKESDSNKLVIKLSAPNINILDVFTKQYFQPIPVTNPSVKNLFLGGDKGPLLYNINTKKGYVLELNEEKSDFNQLYGCGNEFANYKDWWSPGAYYVSKVTEQDMRFNLNQSYFDNFPKDMFQEDNSQKKIRGISTKYGGSYSDQLTFEQFKSNELDQSKIPYSEYSTVVKKYKDDFRTEGVYAAPRTDLIPFNTDVYIKNDKTKYYEPWSDKYPESQKVVMPNGTTRVLKSLINQDYYNAIIKDYYKTDGNSATIRHGIIDILDWYSLAALATPDNSPAFQNSVIPYGNFRWELGTGIDGVDATKEVSSYYELAMKHTNKYGLVRRGDGFRNPLKPDDANGHWTFESYIWWWEKQFRKQ